MTRLALCKRSTGMFLMAIDRTDDQSTVSYSPRFESGSRWFRVALVQRLSCEFGVVRTVLALESSANV